MNRRSYLIVSLTLALSLLLVSPASALFLPSNGQAATLVLGQPDFVSSTAASTPSGFSGPRGVAVDPTSGKVFVADTKNNRVLRFASVSSLSNGAAAEAVLGQPDFNSTDGRTGPDGMSWPAGIAVDASGRLWVADSVNYRVLRFDNASSKASGAGADGVLGQPDFTQNTPHTTQDGVNEPEDVAVDASGRLWVADTFNFRILRFDNAASKPNGANADGVLGQPDFVSLVGQTTADGMSAPYGVATDTAGRLWVADTANDRVLRFDNAAAKPNGADADGVLGEPDFTTRAIQHGTPNGMAEPAGVALDANGGLYVADNWNNRILVFDSAASLPNGANADYVLGQPDFVASSPNTGGLSAASLDSPLGLFFDPSARVLWAADQENNRALMYGQPYATTHIMPFIGLVRLFLPPGVTPIGSISIQTADGSVHTFDVSPDVRILPAKRAGQIAGGSFVTVLTRLDDATGRTVVFQIIVHPSGVGRGSVP